MEVGTRTINVDLTCQSNDLIQEVECSAINPNLFFEGDFI